ncbi:uncharacterized protein LOC107359804, partial [Tetranychus urticae]|uniref:uncharacterized protein LOC107359804 n=1 Tax=Tetranychus urticae TaxID=32264 RepID=UPI00077B96A5
MFKISHIPQMVLTLGCGFVIKADNINVRMVKTPNYLMKIIDQVLKQRILNNIDQMVDRNLQFAYLNDCNRMDMVGTIIQHWPEHKKSTLFKLDISKAFDTVNAGVALKKIQKYCDISTFYLLVSVMSERWLKINKERQNWYCKENQGVPQGTAIGPLLFIIALDEPLRQISQKGIFIKSYADDIVIITRKPPQEILSLASEVMQTINLKLNHEKTETYSYNSLGKGEVEILARHCGHLIC